MMRASQRETTMQPDPQTLARYAELIVAHGLNVQPEQLVLVSTEPIHRDLALAVCEQAYARGARYVDLELAEPRTTRLRVERSAAQHLDYVPGYFGRKMDELVEERGAVLRIIGGEDPEVLVGLDPAAVNRLRLARYQAMKPFYERGINQSQVHWSIAAAATPRWGQQVFPGLAPDEACARLWQAIFAATRADQPDCLARWDAHNATLARRGKLLTELAIDTLHFVGLGTDLTVGLSPRARFKGGSDVGPHGARFEPNVPTEEVFTTPDWRRTEGHARATRPFLVNGTMVEGLELTFVGGELVDFQATKGGDVYRAYIDSDPGARRLGEVALVGIDSPIHQSGIVFREILFDENAACHIAVGSAYKACLIGGETLSDSDCAELGCNSSSAHLDMMISDEHTDVSARLRDGSERVLLHQGCWAKELA
jgi:aminopeptidase